MTILGPKAYHTYERIVKLIEGLLCAYSVIKNLVLKLDIGCPDLL